VYSESQIEVKELTLRVQEKAASLS